jgi:D-ribose pyranose/furanose isomerase RbsD
MLSRTLQGRYVLLMIFILSLSFNAHSGWRDFLKIFDSKDNESSEVTSVAKEALGNLSESDLIRGLKEALTRGTHKAVSSLGREDGFLANSDVKIPIPKMLRKVEKGLRKIGEDKILDSFVTTMNRAAEKAVPEAPTIFADSVKEKSISDAKEILQGDEAATQYLRLNSGDKLKEKLLPLVKTVTS